MELAGCGPTLGTVSGPVDHETTGPADSLTAIVIERHRLLALANESLVQEVEHLQKGHVLGHLVQLIADKTAFVLGAPLSPDIESELH